MKPKPYNLQPPCNIENIAASEDIGEALTSVITAAWGLTDAIKTLYCECFFYRVHRFFIPPTNFSARFNRINNICIKWQSICDKWMKQPISEAVYSELEQFKQSLYHIKSSLLLLQAWIPQNQ